MHHIPARTLDPLHRFHQLYLLLAGFAAPACPGLQMRCPFGLEFTTRVCDDVANDIKRKNVFRSNFDDNAAGERVCNCPICHSGQAEETLFVLSTADGEPHAFGSALEHPAQSRESGSAPPHAHGTIAGLNPTSEKGRGILVDQQRLPCARGMFT